MFSFQLIVINGPFSKSPDNCPMITVNMPLISGYKMSKIKLMRSLYNYLTYSKLFVVLVQIHWIFCMWLSVPSGNVATMFHP